jgi:hypothetical protein
MWVAWAISFVIADVETVNVSDYLTIGNGGCTGVCCRSGIPEADSQTDCAL